jgi:hypothetical protein
VTFTASATAITATLAKVSGDNQLGVTGAVVITAPSVIVSNSGGQPVSGIAVNFAVATGGGTVTGATQTTGANGIATAGSWILGPLAGANTLAVRAAGITGGPVTFTASSTSTTDQRGIYVYTEHLNTDSLAAVQSLSVPGVDGMTLLLGWASIEPSRGTLNTTSLDRWINTAIAAGKKVVLAIRAGPDTPCWLFSAPACGAASNKTYAGATALRFQVSARQGVGQVACSSDSIAAPWDPVFLSEWDAMLAAVSAHLKAVGTYNGVIGVRLTGVNRTTAELRLPEEILATPCVTNAITTWLHAPSPFRPSKVLQAWNTITASFQTSFGDKLLGLEIVPDSTGNNSYPFPEIDDNGCIYTSVIAPANAPGTCTNAAPLPDQNAPLIARANQLFAGHLSISFQNLAFNQQADQHVVMDALTLGTKIGYQTNDYNNLQTASCGGTLANPLPCTSDTYLSMLETGIYPLGKANNLRALYIEVLPPDALSFPAAILTAHKELVVP